MDLGTSTNEIVRDIRDAIAAGRVGLSEEAVREIVKSNGGAKHIYGIDGYQEAGDPAEVWSFYFDETGALYDPETGTTPAADYIHNVGGILSDDKQKYALYEGAYVPLELDDASDALMFTSNGQTVFGFTYSSTGITVTNPNNMPSPFVLYENELKPIPNFEPELIETIYYDQDTKVYSLNGDEKVYWDIDKIESFAPAILPYSDGNERFGYVTINGTFCIAIGGQNRPTIAFIDDIEQESYLCVLMGGQDSSVKIISSSGTLPSNPLEIFTASISAVVENDQSNIASGLYSHAEGTRTTAKGLFSHAEGYKTTALGTVAHAEGEDTTASSSHSHAEGYKTTADGEYSHAEGLTSTAYGSASHAEGDATTASEEGSHAEGHRSVASGPSSHAEGEDTTASGDTSHAEGSRSVASGSSSHAEGEDTTASGSVSHAEGINTQANARQQHVIGEFNTPDTPSSQDSRGTYVEIVGNGTDDSNRSNARTLDWSGNERLAGSLTLGADTQNEVTVSAQQIAALSNLVTQLSDSLVFKRAQYTYNYAIAANSKISLSANNLGISPPSGFAVLAIRSYSTGNDNVIPRTFVPQVSGTSDAVILRNVSSSEQSGKLDIQIVYCKSSVLSAL